MEKLITYILRSNSKEFIDEQMNYFDGDLKELYVNIDHYDYKVCRPDDYTIIVNTNSDQIYLNGGWVPHSKTNKIYIKETFSTIDRVALEYLYTPDGEEILLSGKPFGTLTKDDVLNIE